MARPLVGRDLHCQLALLFFRLRALLALRWNSFALVLLLLVFGIAQFASAQEPGNQFLLISGEVNLTRTPAGQATATRAANAADQLTNGDLIQTGSNGRAQIRFTDGGLISLQPNTQFRIDDYHFDASKHRGFFSLLRGMLRASSGAIGKKSPDDYKLQTPTASVGIRAR